MKITDTKNCPNCPGIYLIRNLINNKCYVGQSIKLRKRLFAHNKNIRNNADYPIYKAINKYGIDNFEYIVLEQIIDKLEIKELKSKLDNLEKYYIEKYDSYKNGYNQTIGGDGGILGYVMTDEQRKKISEHANPKKSKCIAYKDDDNILYFNSILEASEYFNINRSSISKRISGDIKSPLNNYYFAESLDLLKINPKFNKLSKENIQNIKTRKDLIESGICRKTFYNYLKLYNLPSPFKKEIYEYVITDLESNFLFRGNSNDCAQYFNIGEKYFKKIIKESPYKNKYYIHILNKEYKEDVVYHFINNKTGYTYTSIYYDKFNLDVDNFNDIINEQ